MKINKILLIGLLLGLLASITVINCDDKPTPPPEPEEHLFYIAPAIGNMVKVFSVEQAAMVDSFVVDSVDETWQMRIHVIGDDSLLAVSTAGKTFLVDLETKGVISTFPRESVVFSRDSRYYFNYNPTGLWSNPDHTLITDETGAIFWASFCNQTETMSYVYTEPVDDENWPGLGLYSITGDSVSNHLKYLGELLVATTFSYPITRLGKVFVSMTYPGYGLVAADFGSDTVRTLKLFNMWASIVSVVGADDKYVFFSDYGLTQIEFAPSEYIFVYDANSEDSVASIRYEGIDMVDYMVISNDSRYLVARPYNEFDNITTICLIDAKNFNVIGVYDCGYLPGVISSKFASRNGW